MIVTIIILPASTILSSTIKDKFAYTGLRPIAPVGAASRTRVLARALWGWGTQPWNTVVTILVFPVYLIDPSFGSANHTAYVQFGTCSWSA